MATTKTAKSAAKKTKARSAKIKKMTKKSAGRWAKAAKGK